MYKDQLFWLSATEGAYEDLYIAGASETSDVAITAVLVMYITNA